VIKMEEYVIEKKQTVKDFLNNNNIPENFIVIRKKGDVHIKLDLDDVIDENDKIVILAPIRGG